MKPAISALALSVLMMVGPAPRQAKAATPKVVYPHGDKLAMKWKGGSPIKLGPHERVAFLMLLTIDNLQGQCQLFFHRYCTLEELVKGKKTDQGMLGLKVNPAWDKSYKYAVGVSGKTVGMSARPTQKGLGGFLWIQREFGGDCYFNPHGTATGKSKKVGWYSFTGIDLSRDAMPGGSEARF